MEQRVRKSPKGRPVSPRVRDPDWRPRSPAPSRAPPGFFPTSSPPTDPHPSSSMLSDDDDPPPPFSFEVTSDPSPQPLPAFFSSASDEHLFTEAEHGGRGSSERGVMSDFSASRGRAHACSPRSRTPKASKSPAARKRGSDLTKLAKLTGESVSKGLKTRSLRRLDSPPTSPGQSGVTSTMMRSPKKSPKFGPSDSSSSKKKFKPRAERTMSPTITVSPAAGSGRGATVSGVSSAVGGTSVFVLEESAVEPQLSRSERTREASISERKKRVLFGSVSSNEEDEDLYDSGPVGRERGAGAAVASPPAAYAPSSPSRQRPANSIDVPRQKLPHSLTLLQQKQSKSKSSRDIRAHTPKSSARKRSRKDHHRTLEVRKSKHSHAASVGGTSPILGPLTATSVSSISMTSATTTTPQRRGATGASLMGSSFKIVEVDKPDVSAAPKKSLKFEDTQQRRMMDGRSMTVVARPRGTTSASSAASSDAEDLDEDDDYYDESEEEETEEFELTLFMKTNESKFRTNKKLKQFRTSGNARAFQYGFIVGFNVSLKIHLDNSKHTTVMLTPSSTVGEVIGTVLRRRDLMEDMGHFGAINVRMFVCGTEQPMTGNIFHLTNGGREMDEFYLSIRSLGEDSTLSLADADHRGPDFTYEDSAMSSKRAAFKQAADSDHSVLSQRWDIECQQITSIEFLHRGAAQKSQLTTAEKLAVRIQLNKIMKSRFKPETYVVSERKKGYLGGGGSEYTLRVTDEGIKHISRSGRKNFITRWTHLKKVVSPEPRQLVVESYTVNESLARGLTFTSEATGAAGSSALSLVGDRDASSTVASQVAGAHVPALSAIGSGGVGIPSVIPGSSDKDPGIPLSDFYSNGRILRYEYMTPEAANIEATILRRQQFIWDLIESAKRHAIVNKFNQALVKRLHGLGHAVFDIGDVVRLTQNRVGIVVYKGSVHFAMGEHYGVALIEGSGDHDGKREGIRYFKTKREEGGTLVPLSQIVRKINIGGKDWCPMHNPVLGAVAGGLSLRTLPSMEVAGAGHDEMTEGPVGMPSLASLAASARTPGVGSDSSIGPFSQQSPGIGVLKGSAGSGSGSSLLAESLQGSRVHAVSSAMKMSQRKYTVESRPLLKAATLGSIEDVCLCADSNAEDDIFLSVRKNLLDSTTKEGDACKQLADNWRDLMDVSRSIKSQGLSVVREVMNHIKHLCLKRDGLLFRNRLFDAYKQRKMLIKQAKNKGASHRIRAGMSVYSRLDSVFGANPDYVHDRSRMGRAESGADGFGSSAVMGGAGGLSVGGSTVSEEPSIETELTDDLALVDSIMTDLVESAIEQTTLTHDKIEELNMICEQLCIDEILRLKNKMVYLRRCPQSYFGIRSQIESKEYWQTAAYELSLMRGCLLPSEKVNAMLHCIKAIYEHFDRERNESKSAIHGGVIHSGGKIMKKAEAKINGDDLLPIVIYVIVQSSALCFDATPPVTEADLMLIEGLGDPVAQQSEVGYYIALFHSALKWIADFKV